MIKVLRDNRDGWLSCPKLSNISFIDIVSHDVGISSFVDGVFVYAPRNVVNEIPDLDESRTTIHFHQLPSINKGTSYKYWHHCLNWNVINMAIQPEIDLLVLFTYDSLPDDKTSYHIQLRTMSTNDPHPLAASTALPLPDLDFLYVNPSHLILHDDFVHIHGRMIGLHLNSGDSVQPRSLTVIWNWMTGTKVAYPALQSPGLYSMTFISEQYFILPRRAMSNQYFQFAKLGHLEVYPIPNYDQTQPFARFMLPEPYKVLEFIFIGLDGNCPTLPPTAATRSYSRPRIYESSSEDRQLCLLVDVGLGDAGRGWLYISTKALLKFLREANGSDIEPLSHNESLEIPWSVWGSCTSWIPHFGDESHSVFLWGQRCAVLRADYTEITDSDSTFDRDLYIIDFDQNRTKAYSLLETCRQIAALELPPERLVEMHKDRNLALGDRVDLRVFRDTLHSDARYLQVKATLKGAEELLREKGIFDIDDIDDESNSSPWLMDVMMDDEHVAVIVAKGDGPIPIGLLVYTP